MTNLPADMPPSWLAAIKSATQQSWLKTVLTTILGSSVIAGGISFFGDSYRDQRNAEREAKKILQKETIESYGELGKKIHDFQSDLDDAKVTIKYSIVNKDRSLDKEIDKSIVAIARKIVAVNRALNAPRITDNDLKAKTRDLFTDLPKLLEETQKDKKAGGKVIKLCQDKLDKQIEDVKTQIETVRNSIPLE